MEQIIGGILLFGLLGLVWWAQSASQSALDDPDNDKVVYLHQLVDVVKLCGRGSWVVTIMRQSGNVHSTKVVDGDAAAALQAALATFRRAGIDAVALVTNEASELNVRRLFHNHRGSNEGKKVGGAVIKLVTGGVPAASSRSVTISDPTVTWTCDCGGKEVVKLFELTDEIRCRACGNVKALSDRQIALIHEEYELQKQAALARIEAGEDAVTIDGTIADTDG